MKITKALMILFALFTLVLGWLYFNTKETIDSCQKSLVECKTELTDFKSKCNLCEGEDQNLRILSKNYDFSLKIDYKKFNIYQPFQYDIANGYSILGSLIIDENSELIRRLDFELYEAGTCKRYRMEKITHTQKNNKHVFEVKIEPFERSSGSETYSLNKAITFTNKDIVYVKINSDNLPQLRTNFSPNIDGYTMEQTENMVRHFPPFICPAQVYDGTNN